MPDGNPNAEKSAADPGDGTDEATWEGAGEPNASIVAAVAAATDRDQRELSPLGRHVDADALGAILSSGANGSDGSVRVSFDWDGVRVDAASDGSVEVRPDGDSPTSDGPRTASELDAALQRLFAAAVENGVDVDGGWEVRNGPGGPHFDVHVTRMADTD